MELLWVWIEPMKRLAINESLCDFVLDFDWVTCLLHEYLLLHLKSCKVFIIGCVTYVVMNKYENG